MPLRGDPSAFAGFIKSIRKLPEASKEIARELSVKLSPLIGESFSAQASPEGAGWPATQTGAPAFLDSDPLGYVLSRVVGTTVRTALLYPLSFHQEGTRAVGRKRMAAIRRGILGAAGQAAARAIKLPRKRADESEFAYQQRIAIGLARKAARKEAVQGAKMRADFAAEQARAASGWHDPPRPMIPEEGSAIPDSWDALIQATAREVMARYGATPKGA